MNVPQSWQGYPSDARSSFPHARQVMASRSFSSGMVSSVGESYPPYAIESERRGARRRAILRVVPRGSMPPLRTSMTLRPRHEEQRREWHDLHLDRRLAHQLSISLDLMGWVGVEADVATAAVEDAFVGGEVP